jgi:ATP-binding cassette, subfamily B, bacterial HlyB/CyaB
MQQIVQGRTVIVIAHRLSTVRRAHRIYVVEKGEIVEEGPHDELVKRNGWYARLYRHQLGPVGRA